MHSMIKKIDLGAVSAYALAVEKGYTGTEEEFTELLTNTLNYATQAQESASAAAGSAEEAGNYKTQAREILASVNLAGTQQIEAIEAAGTQQTNAAKEAIEAKGKETLDSIPDSYETLQGDVTQLRGDLSGLIDSVGIEKKYIIKDGTGVTTDLFVEAGKTYKITNTGENGYTLFIENKSQEYSVNCAVNSTILFTPLSSGYIRIYGSQTVGNYYRIKLFGTIENEIEEVKNNINSSIQDTESIKDIETALEKSRNLFDKTNVENGYYYSVPIGSEVQKKENSQYSCIIIPAKPNTAYAVSHTDFSIGQLDSDNIVIGTSSGSTFTTDANTSKISVSVKTVNVDSYMIVEGNTIPTIYEPYKSYMWVDSVNKHLEEIDEKINISYEYHVGNGFEYTSFIDCIRSLKDDERKKTIYVHGGEYNIFEEIGGIEYCSSIPSDSAWRDVCDFIPKNTKVVGIGEVIFRFEPSDNEIPHEVAGLISCLNISDSCEIENIEIRAKNCRYAIHDETSSIAKYDGSTRRYKNVRCYKTSGTHGYSQVFGCGFQKNMKYDFEDCIFEKIGGGNTFSMHNSSMGGYTGAQINIKDCVFIASNSSNAIEFINNSMNDTHNIVRITNSVFIGNEKKLSVRGGESSPNMVNTFDVQLIGCTELIDTEVLVQTENKYPIKQYNPVISV